jgi:hypothetical protein
LGFVRLWQELLRRFATPTKPQLLQAKLPLPSLTQGVQNQKIFDKDKIVFTQNNVQPQFFLYIYEMKK